MNLTKYSLTENPEFGIYTEDKKIIKRVVSFITNLAKDYGKKIGEEYFVKPFLTHQDIAKLTACSRQTVNSILTDLREQKIINFDRRKLIISNMTKLKELL